MILVSNYSKSFIKKLKTFIKNNVSDELIKDIVSMNDELLVKTSKCKVCNKKYNSNNKFYGSSCTRNLYHNADITYSKDIENKELFLHSAIILSLGKENLTEKEMSYVTESYLSLLYFEKLEYPKSKIIENGINKCIEKNTKPIMKLNTAYRITNILNRNSDLLSNKDKLDKFVDNNTLKLFKRYFNFNKKRNIIDYQVNYYMQILFWECVILGGISVYDYRLSAKCLKHSLSIIGEQPKDMIISDKEVDIIKAIKAEEGFKEKIQFIIKKYAKDGKLTFNKNTIKNNKDNSYEFVNGDLFYSLHNVTIELSGKKRNDKWTLNIILIDTYDFTEILSNDIITKGNNKYISKGIALTRTSAFVQTSEI